jgi:hypothetical protein
MKPTPFEGQIGPFSFITSFFVFPSFQRQVFSMIRICTSKSGPFGYCSLCTSIYRGFLFNIYTPFSMQRTPNSVVDQQS